jgi:mono/diheme cytochrome c family protein
VGREQSFGTQVKTMQREDGQVFRMGMGCRAGGRVGIGRLAAPMLLLAQLAAVASAAEPVDYERDVKPILKNKCYACHGQVKQKSGLRLDAGKLILAGGDGGKVIVAGKSGDSPLIERVTSKEDGERMPPEGAAPLSSEQIALLKNWIDQGAKFPEHETIPRGPADHWAFQPLQPVAVPAVKDEAWPLNAIDRFVLARLEARGWKPNGPGEPHSLLRRAYLDLIGLPPTIAEQEKFAVVVAGERIGNPFYGREAWERVVNGLLSRTEYGERYARHWLDVVRYADSNGYERDGAKPEVWKYRDYVIRSLNDDKPFDRFVLEQLAGDELPDANGETVTATGFNRLGPWDDEPADFDVDRYDQLDDLVNTTSQAFLALTMGCARCHDHKFDPLSQRDYYSLVAVFNPLKRPQNGRTELTRYLAPPAQARRLQERDKQIAELNDRIAKIRDAFRSEFLAAAKTNLPDEVLAAFRAEENQRTPDQKRLVRENQQRFDDALADALPENRKSEISDLKSQIARLREETPDVPVGYFLSEPSPEPPKTHILLRGSPGNPGAEVGPAVPKILVKEQPPFLPPDEFTTRRRLSFARWVVDPANPLTARVIVNRVWQWHFGQGLVRTPNDFGLIGETPTHPELLDYLAHWFVHEAHWSLKDLHRFIMTSRTYQMSRATNDDYAAADPDNRLLWRRSYHRLEVEAIRDSMLAVSGRLNRQMFGPPMHPFIPREALLNHADKTTIWPAFDEKTASRRTVYAFIKRSLLVPMLEVLDLCDTTRSFPRRNVTTVPTQALTLYNGDFVNREAAHFAARLQKEAGDDVAKQIELAWRLAFCRMPTPTERSAMTEFLSEEAAHIQQESGDNVAAAECRQRALTQMCRVILNMNEFVYPD